MTQESGRIAGFQPKKPCDAGVRTQNWIPTKKAEAGVRTHGFQLKKATRRRNQDTELDSNEKKPFSRTAFLVNGRVRLMVGFFTTRTSLKSTTFIFGRQAYKISSLY